MPTTINSTDVDAAFNIATKAVADAEKAVSTNDPAAKSAHDLMNLIRELYLNDKRNTYTLEFYIESYKLVSNISNSAINAALASNISNAAVKASESAINNIKIGNYSAAVSDISLAYNYASAAAASAASAASASAFVNSYVDTIVINLVFEAASSSAAAASAASAASAAASAAKAAEAVSSINNYIQIQNNNDNDLVVVVAAAKAMGLILTSV